MFEGVIIIIEEIEEFKKKFVFFGKIWLIRILLVYKLYKC